MDPSQLADAGGWAVVIAMMSAIGVGSIRGWWVPGFVYRREVDRADRATDQIDQSTSAIREQTQVMRELTSAVNGRLDERGR